MNTYIVWFATDDNIDVREARVDATSDVQAFRVAQGLCSPHEHVRAVIEDEDRRVNDGLTDTLRLVPVSPVEPWPFSVRHVLAVRARTALARYDEGKQS